MRDGALLEAIAADALAAAGIEEAPTRMHLVVASLGLYLEMDYRMPAGVEGVMVRCGDAALIRVNPNKPWTRRHWTIAHEVGHYLHPEHVEGAYLLTADASVPRYHDRTEVEVNMIAAHLLMPAHWVREAWSDTQNLGRMAQRFLVSQQAMKLRLRCLGLTPGRWYDIPEEMRDLLDCVN